MNWQPRPPKYQGIVRNPVSRQGGGGFRGTDTGMQPAAPAPNGGAVMSPAPAQKATSPQLGNPAMPAAKPQPQPQPMMQAQAAAPAIDTQTPVEGEPDPWGHKDPVTGQTRPLTEEGFLQLIQAKIAAGRPLTAIDLSAVNLYAPNNQALRQAILDFSLGKSTAFNYTPNQQVLPGRPTPVVPATGKGGMDYSRPPMTGAPAAPWVPPVRGGQPQPVAQPPQPLWNGGVEPQASVYDRPQMAPPPQFAADVDVAATQQPRYQVRAGGVSRAGKGIYTG